MSVRKGDLIYIVGHPEMEPRVRLEDGEIGAMCALSDTQTLKEYGLEVVHYKGANVVRFIKP